MTATGGESSDTKSNSSSRRRSERSRKSSGVKKYTVCASSEDTLALLKLKIYQEIPSAIPNLQVLFVRNEQLVGHKKTLQQLRWASCMDKVLL